MKPLYERLNNNHYSSTEETHNFLSRKELYKEIGYDDEVLIKESKAYKNTCATRMSLALIKSGVHFNGRLKIKSGPYKGRHIEPGSKLLADQLSREGVFGKPKIYKGGPSELIAKLNGKKGVIFFWKLAGYGGGHIDLIEVDKFTEVCHSQCNFLCQEVWFWPLN